MCWKELKKHARNLSELHQLCQNIDVKKYLLGDIVPCSLDTGAGLELVLANNSVYFSLTI